MTEYDIFCELGADLELEFARPLDADWAKSPFGWLRTINSRAKGAVGERLMCGWAREMGIFVGPPANSDHDRRFDGVPVEIKMSLLWDGGAFVFQQIRDQDYDVACLLGIGPANVQLWAVPKAVLWANAQGQHTGFDAQETRWLRFQADDPPAWIQPYGGDLRQAAAALAQSQIIGTCLF